MKSRRHYKFTGEREKNKEKPILSGRNKNKPHIVADQTEEAKQQET